MEDLLYTAMIENEELLNEIPDGID